MEKIDQQDVLIRELTTRGTREEPVGVLKHEHSTYSGQVKI